MVSHKGTDEDERSSPREKRGSFGRLLLRIASQLFGGSVVTTEPSPQPAPQQQQEPPGATEPDAELIALPEQSLPRPGPILRRSKQAAEAAHTLEQTLDHFEAMLEALEGQVRPNGMRERSAPAAEPAAPGPAAFGTTEAMNSGDWLNNGSLDRLQETLNRLATQAQRLADGASDLAQVAGQMEARLAEVTRVARSAPPAAPPLAQEPAHVEEPEPEEPAAAPIAAELAQAETDAQVLEPDEPAEPRFVPTDTPLSVALAGVPGFQGLMDAQRALSGMAQAENASVIAFKNGEAALEVVLSAPVTARQIVEGVRDGTGEQLLIEESRPDAGKLRLRFVTR